MEIQRDQLDAIVEAANTGDTQGVLDTVDQVLKDNGVVIYYLWVRWQEVGGKAPLRTTTWDWPEKQRALIRQDHKISRDDVDTLLRTRATNPADVHVTRDVNYTVGWTILNDYIFA